LGDFFANFGNLLIREDLFTKNNIYVAAFILPS